MDDTKDQDFLGASVTMKGRFIFTFVMPHDSPGEHTLYISVWSQGGTITPGLTQSTTVDVEWLEESFILSATTPLDDRLVDIINNGLTGISTTLQSINTFLVSSIMEIMGKLNSVDDQIATLFTDQGFFGDQDNDACAH